MPLEKIHSTNEWSFYEFIDIGTLVKCAFSEPLDRYKLQILINLTNLQTNTWTFALNRFSDSILVHEPFLNRICGQRRCIVQIQFIHHVGPMLFDRF